MQLLGPRAISSIGLDLDLQLGDLAGPLAQNLELSLEPADLVGERSDRLEFLFQIDTALLLRRKLALRNLELRLRPLQLGPKGDALLLELLGALVGGRIGPLLLGSPALEVGHLRGHSVALATHSLQLALEQAHASLGLQQSPFEFGVGGDRAR